VSIVLTSIIGFFFLGNHVDFIVILGYIVTIISIFNYTLDSTPTSLPAAVGVADTGEGEGSQGKSEKELKGKSKDDFDGNRKVIEEDLEMQRQRQMNDEESFSRKLIK
jgi:hypothetical protein